MSFRDVLHALIDRAGFANESEVVAAKAAVDEHLGATPPAAQAAADVPADPAPDGQGGGDDPAPVTDPSAEVPQP